jgi:hypothetical protein
VTWWAVFGLVIGVLLVGALVGAAVADRRARARGVRYHPELARSMRRRRGELRDQRAAAVLRTRHGRPAGPERDRPGRRHS